MCSPRLLVIVASDCNERRHGRQLIKNLGRPDVSAMNDVIAADGESPRFRSHQAVSVRQQRDAQGIFSAHGIPKRLRRVVWRSRRNSYQTINGRLSAPNDLFRGANAVRVAPTGREPSDSHDARRPSGLEPTRVRGHGTPRIPVPKRNPHAVAAQLPRAPAAVQYRCRWPLRPTQWWVRLPRSPPCTIPKITPYEKLSLNTPY